VSDDRDLLRKMLLIRAFDEKVDELYAEGRVHGTAHFYVGQEAVAVGAIAALRDGDVITGTHRGHGHAIAFGLDVDRMALELLGKVGGYCHGKGGSMHIADVEAGMLGANGIVAGSMGIACGAGWAFKCRGEPRVALCFFGDGGAQEGMFHEALNLASVWKLPVVFVCENNHYAMSLSVADGFAIEHIADKAPGYGIAGETVDGMEVGAVRAAVGRAVEVARDGGGPSLVEAVTYRYLGHSKSDANRYRTREEIAEWRDRDPIARFALAMGLEPDALETARREAFERIAGAFEEAERAPEPDPESALEDVYA
jgi:TPP-dependent pyruvate/acetoin dehydrogenase alpha subunit